MKMVESNQNTPTALGTESIGKLLLQYSVPAIIAMSASSIYNMVDSIFIGQGVGPMAISGLALTFPIMNLAAALGAMVGIGAATLVSVTLGRGDRKSAMDVLGNVILINAILGFAFGAVTLFYLDEILYFFGASDQTLPYARDFMQVILCGNIVTHLYLGLNNIIRASGYPQKAMMAMLLAVGVNIVLAALFIFVFDWGIRGAALATVIAQTAALGFELLHLADSKNCLHMRRGIFKLKKKIIGSILSVGLSPFLINACSCLIIILINHNLKTYGGDIAIGAYGILNRFVFIFIMIIFGLNQGMQPIVGFNLGAGKPERVLLALKYTTITAVAIATFGFLLCESIPHYIARMFTTDRELIDISAHGLRIVVAVFPLVGLQVVSSSFFQSIRNAKKAIFLSLTRQLLFLVPGLIILPRYYGVDGVWISMPIADTVAAVISVVMLCQQINVLKRQSRELQQAR